jgi:hypothetical protein
MSAFAMELIDLGALLESAPTEPEPPPAADDRLPDEDAAP